MAPHKTVTINGRQYDAITGLPVTDPPQAATPTAATSTAPKTTKETTPPKQSPKEAPKTPEKPAPRTAATPAVTAQPRAPRPQLTRAYRQDVIRTKKPAQSAQSPQPKPATTSTATAKKSSAVHTATLQHSQTLNRRVTRKPAVAAKTFSHTTTDVASSSATTTATKNTPVARSSRVTHFAKDPVIPAPKPAVASTTTAKAAQNAAAAPAQSHPIARRTLSRLSQKKQARAAAKTPKTAAQVKDAEIARALAAPKAVPAKKKRTLVHRKKRTLSTRSRIAIGIGIAAGVILIALLLVYRFVPTVSVSIAASQAGIHATYPEYTPDGYSLHQPVQHKDGEVSLTFHSNSNDNYYKITQTNSTWDSSAVLDNIVTPATGDDYVTTKERGLTIYTYGSIATWVNGGVLYTIDSKAPLTGEQIRRIATSL